MTQNEQLSIARPLRLCIKLEQRRCKLAYHIRQAAKKLYGLPTMPYSTRQLEAIAKALELKIR